MERQEVIVKEDGLRYCPHCGECLDDVGVIVETQGFAKLKIQDNSNLGMCGYYDNEVEYYLSFECKGCGGEIIE